MASVTQIAIDPEQILVGVPTFNEATHIESCLRSLMADAPVMERVRVVVADGGSTDETCRIVERLREEFSNLSLIKNPDRLQSAALNHVVKRCATPKHVVLVRCDAHAVYPPGYVSRVAESLLSRDAATLVTTMDAAGERCFQKAAAWVVDTPVGSGGAAHRGSGRHSAYVDHGHHAGFRLDWYRRVGGYDPSFSHNEDAEFDYRLRLAGGRIWLDAAIRLDYQMRDSLVKIARQYWFYGRGRARTALKHRMQLRTRQMIPVLNLVGLIVCIGLTSLHPCFLLGPAAYLALLVGVSLVIAVRHRSACGLLAGPTVGTIHLAWGAGFMWQALTRGAKR